ncbi:MAG: hypothetical protein K2X00_11215, partial [Nitrospiraceae bacterium]|nr:hypothetical protein [Nitrospiraceae bacterium]
IIDLNAQLTWDGENNDRLSSIENALGSSFNDTLNGSNGNNVLDGGDGGADQINGNGGSDTVSYASSSRRVTIDLTARSTWDDVNNDSLSSIENAIGSSFNDTLIGDSTDNVLDGGDGGSDAIDGKAGSDTVSYATSSRAVTIDFYNSLTWDGANNDRLFNIENAIGSAGNDTFLGNSLDNVLDGGSGGRDIIDGQGGIDTVSYAQSSQGIFVDLANSLGRDDRDVDTILNIENIRGSSFNDVLYGNDADNLIDGGSGGADLIFGGGGRDTVSYRSSDRSVIIDMDADITWDGINNDRLNSIENAVGSAFDDTFVDDVGNNSYVGGGGNDVITYEKAVSGIFYDYTTVRSGEYLDNISGISGVIGSDYADTFKAFVIKSIDGRNGIDTVDLSDIGYTSSYERVVTDLDAGYVRAVSKYFLIPSASGTIKNVENVIGSGIDDYIVDKRGVDNVLSGGVRNSADFDNRRSDTFEFIKGSGNDTITDFDSLDKLVFRGYGSIYDGAHFEKIDNTHWAIHSADGTSHDTITFSNGANISDNAYLFIA